MIAVSACLLGYMCRYDGKNKKNRCLLEVLESDEIMPICPEQLGGLPTPRYPSNLLGGDGFDVLDGKAKVVSIYGIDNTKAFLKGAHAALYKIRKNNITLCYLKGKSPSCGAGTCARLCAGTDKRAETNFIAGRITGVTAALLMREKIKVKSIG